MIENVLFDLDGTLLDTREGIIESVRFAAGALGYQQLSYDELLTFVGPPIQQSFIDHYNCDAQTAQKAAGIFRDYYKDEALLRAIPYDGIYELCEELKKRKIKMAVATYKREDYALRLLKYFHFDDYCMSMHGADNNNVLKKADIVDLCLKEMSAEPDKTVLIGDTDHDAKGAKLAGIHFIAVTYGFGFKSKAELSEYDNIGVAESPLDVLRFL